MRFEGFKHTEETKRRISESLKGKGIGKNNSNWKGGKRKDPRGYVLIYKPDHHRVDSRNYTLEHILVAEKMLGRLLKYYGKKHKDNEIVHHIDGNKSNNYPYNIYVSENRSEHRKLHSQLEKISFELINKGIIKFDKIKGEYYYNDN